MAIGIDDLDDDDVLEPSQPEPSQISVSQESSSDDDFMTDYLRSKGIDDPSRIKFEDDNNNIVERSWNDLTREEQFNILNTPVTQQVQDNSNDLSNEEIEFINLVRNSNMTPQQYLESLQQTPVQEPTYKVDDLSDDEIYLLDLESRVGELSEDEAVQALNNVKQNEDFYKKQVEGIRKEYKEREDFKEQQDQLTLQQEQQAAFDEYQRVVVNAIDDFTSVGNLDLNFDDADKEELADFMLAQDETGVNYLQQALQDPQTLVKAAWFILNGDEAFNSISDYFANQIKLVSQNQYNKGFEDAKKGIAKKPSVVINKNNVNSSHQKQYGSIDELDDED